MLATIKRQENSRVASFSLGVIDSLMSLSFGHLFEYAISQRDAKGGKKCNQPFLSVVQTPDFSFNDISCRRVVYTARAVDANNFI